MADRTLFRLSATLAATFANYAGSSAWAAIHLGQFVCTAILLAGLLVLYFALDVSQGAPLWSRAGALRDRHYVDGTSLQADRLCWILSRGNKRLSTYLPTLLRL